MDIDNGDEFWWKDPISILFKADRLKQFIPTKQMTFNEKLNAMSRFIIYLSWLILITGHYEIALGVLVIGLGLIIFIHQYDINISLKSRNNNSPDTVNATTAIATSNGEIQPYDPNYGNDLRGATWEEPQSHNNVANPTANTSYQSPEQTLKQDKKIQVEDLEGFCGSQMASVDMVRDAFTPNKGNPARLHERNNNPNPDANDPGSNFGGFAQYNQQGAGSCDSNLNCGRVNTNTNITQYNAPDLKPPKEEPSSTCTWNPVTNPEQTCDANGNCQKPSVSNPFMNILVTDYANNPTRAPACTGINDNVNNDWSNNLYRNVNDVFDRGNGQLIFNTQSSTTIPNDQEAYRKWLYHVPYVCKDGDQDACYRTAELQTNRHGMIFSPQGP